MYSVVLISTEVMKMELYQELLQQVFQKWVKEISLPQETILQLVEMESYSILKKIKQILENETLSDPECFMEIENILTVMEESGITVAGRHDFG